jgi:hypothetical protein
MNEQESQRLTNIEEALYGNPKNGVLGLVNMNQEMYDAWKILIAFGKFISVATVFFAAIGTGWLAFGSSIKRVTLAIFGIGKN